MSDPSAPLRPSPPPVPHGRAPATVRLEYLPAHALHGKTREAIWHFFSCYVRRERDTFDKKLASTEELWLAGRTTGEIAGFGATDVIVVSHEGRSYGFIVTHWAALSAELRGHNIIQKVGLRCFLRFRIRYPRVPAYWLFGASTYKSYLLLARNFTTYWPHPHRVWPAREQALRDRAMAHLGDAAWDPEKGVLRRFGVSRYAEGVVVDEPSVLNAPEIKFYHQCNPHQADGDSLMCLAPLDASNWLSIARSAVIRALR